MSQRTEALAQRLEKGAHALAAENAVHARHFADVDKPTTLNLLRRNSAAAAAVVRTLGDTELDRAGRVSFCGNAHLTCQFVLEDRVVRHSYHHLARMIMTLTRTAGTVLAA